MAIRYTKHADRRLVQRNIAKAWIELALASPDRKAPDPSDEQLTRAYKNIPDAGGRVLRVVYTTVKTDTLIVTALFDRDAE
jgi:hypothetical protein